METPIGRRRDEEEEDDAWALELEEELDLEGIHYDRGLRTGSTAGVVYESKVELEEKPAAASEQTKETALARSSLAATLPQEVLALIISFGQVGRVCKSWSLASIAVARRRFSSRLADILRPLDTNALAVALDVEAELYAAYGQSYESQEFDFGVVKQKLLSSHAASTDHDLTGQVVWPVSAFLAWYLVAHRDEIAGKNVVELGAGAGLSGLVASQFASHTALTDGNDIVLELLEENAETNADSSKVQALPLLWGDHKSVEAFEHAFPYPVDVLIGADVVAESMDNTASHISVGEQQVVATMTKKPLLSKLRLRPHSPSVTMGSGSHTGDTSSGRRKSASSVLSMPSFDSDEDSGTGLQVLQPSRRPATEENKRTSSVVPSPNKLSGESRKKSGSGLWRSLTSFKSSKRSAKAAIEDKRSHGQLQVRTGVSELHKHAVLASSRAEEAKLSEIGYTSEHLVFLKRNAVEWNRNIQQLVDISKNNSTPTSGGTTSDQMTALLDEDAAFLTTLNNCKQWFVDPQLWTIDQATARPEGEIRCPRESCGAIVGEWRWEGLRYVESSVILEV
ncbi:hypothetical protein AM588_10002513 [Phytophthora nicotianae]|uniref:Uncharacterized protein n=1 Tax=Phytophthora nicotianae TaxID=4792 RepID=A0A0W8D0U7_PHYNI|nr:hypothetical protein AM588_10002513 [Phytophthora nicotianae]